MPAFFNAIDDHFFQHHLIRYRSFAGWRAANFIKGQIDEQTKQTPEWSSQWFCTKKFAAFHVEIELANDYCQTNYKRAKKGTKAADRNTVENDVETLYWLFRQEFARNITRLWVDFSTRTYTKNIYEYTFCEWFVLSNELDSVLYGDQRLIDELIRWLSEPLPPRQPPPSNFDSFNWQPPTLSGCERILHIGSERSVLDMALVGDFIQTLVDVCFSIMFVTTHHLIVNLTILFSFLALSSIIG